jgi:ribosomal protein S18 acetylase RimI-like enzyme
VITIVDAHAPPRLDEARALILEYVAWLGVDLSFQQFDAEMAALPGEYAPPRGGMLVALDDTGAAVGVVALRPLDGDRDWRQPPGTCEMKRMWVRESARGNGAGRALAERVIDRARAAGYARMRLDTLRTMRGANALYERLGFREIPAYRFNPHAEARYLELDLGGSPR